MRLHTVLPGIAASLLTASVDMVGARERPVPRTRVEAGLGVGTRLPGWGDEGIGPFLSAALRFTPVR